MGWQKIKLLLAASLTAIALILIHGWQHPAVLLLAQANPPAVEADAPYLPTPDAVAWEMLKLAQVSSSDTVYDLGSGDGRIPILAAQQFGARAVGIEIDPTLVAKSRANAEAAGVSDRVQFWQQDLFATDLRPATVVTLYLFTSANLKLRPKLWRELKPGTRVVSHAFAMGDWQPDKVVKMSLGDREYKLYSWVIPETLPANFLRAN